MSGLTRKDTDEIIKFAATHTQKEIAAKFFKGSIPVASSFLNRHKIKFVKVYRNIDDHRVVLKDALAGNLNCYRLKDEYGFKDLKAARAYAYRHGIPLAYIKNRRRDAEDILSYFASHSVKSTADKYFNGSYVSAWSYLFRKGKIKPQKRGWDALDGSKNGRKKY